jgi:hypothetical protein
MACRNVTAVTNTHATTEELLDASFSMWHLWYQGEQENSSSQNFLFQNKESQLESGIYLGKQSLHDTKQTDAMCGQNAEFLNVTKRGYIMV